MAAQNHLSQLIAAVAMQRDPSSTIKTDVDEHEYAPQLGVHFGAAHRMSQFPVERAEHRIVPQAGGMDMRWTSAARPSPDWDRRQLESRELESRLLGSVAGRPANAHVGENKLATEEALYYQRLALSNAPPRQGGESERAPGELQGPWMGAPMDHHDGVQNPTQRYGRCLFSARLPYFINFRPFIVAACKLWALCIKAKLNACWDLQ
jgi:hypothetical protein